MSVSSDLARAIQLLTHGDRRKAATILQNIDAMITDDEMRLELIDASLSALDPLVQNDRLCNLALDGMRIAKRVGRQDLESHFMARRANLLTMKVAIAHHGRTSLRLAPSWIGFSTEQDQRRYESLTAEVQRVAKEIDELIGQAVRIAEECGDERILGFVLMDRGSITSSRYLQYKGDHLRDPLRAKVWVRWQILRYPLFERFLLFRGGPGKILSGLVRSFTSDFLRAAALFESRGDPQIASAYYNLANHLRTAYRFRAARRYLRQAHRLAERHGDQWVLQQCVQLEAVIKKRNKDIPDYLSGERRGPPT